MDSVIDVGRCGRSRRCIFTIGGLLVRYFGFIPLLYVFGIILLLFVVGFRLRL